MYPPIVFLVTSVDKCVLKYGHLSLYILTSILLLSCREPVTQTFSTQSCDKYVAAKMGFWIGIDAKAPIKREVRFLKDSFEIIPIGKDRVSSHRINYFLKCSLKLSDTLTMVYQKQHYKIYDFTNVKERATASENHERLIICRISTAKINGMPIKDCRDNMLKIKLN